MARAPLEHDLQRAFIIWARGHRNLPPALLPGVICWSVPNGGTRDGFEAKRLKEEGILAGIPDVHLLWGALHMLEFKTATGRLSPAQIDLHPRLVAAGARVATAYSLDEAKQIVRAWGLTIHGR